jgi:hypothetical protein
LLVVCSLAGFVQAKAVKIKAFVPVLNGVTENPNVDGMAVFNFAEDPQTPGIGRVHMAITITDLLPNTFYRVQVSSEPAGGTGRVPFILISFFETNSAGVGNLTFASEGSLDYTTNPDGSEANVHVFVFIEDDGGTEVDVDADEVRAIGCVSGNCVDPFVRCADASECADGQFCTDDACVAAAGESVCTYADHDCGSGFLCGISFTDPDGTGPLPPEPCETNGETGCCISAPGVP